MKHKGILFLSFVLLGALLSVAVSIPFAFAKTATPPPRTWHAQVGAESDGMAIQGMAFLPEDLWINVGDTVVWTSMAAEIHTVTFLAPGQTLPPFDPTNPQQALPQGGPTFDGTSYHNSGLMANMKGMPTPGGTHSSLTFIAVGNFTYHCLVHPGMSAIVHVRPAGTPYPFSQRDYDRQIERGVDAITKDGRKLMDQAKDMSDNHHVNILGDDLVSLMRFSSNQVTIHVGESITFTNHATMEPHTVTFGTLTGNNFFPTGNPTAFDGSAPLNSGFLGAAFPAGTIFTVHFLKKGTYDFRCDLHDMMGMVIRITVDD
jgi:plastocyanin